MPKNSKLVALNEDAETPEVVLHRTLEKIDHIKSVTIVINWNNDESSWSVDWSRICIKDFVFAGAALDQKVHAQLYASYDPDEDNTFANDLAGQSERNPDAD